MTSQLEWLDLIDKQVNGYMQANGGPTSNPLINIDAKNLKALIGLARQTLGQGRQAVGSSSPEVALQHYQDHLQKQQAFNQSSRSKPAPPPTAPFSSKPQTAPSYLNAVISKISTDTH